MKTNQSKLNGYYESFDQVSNELGEEFSNVFLSIEDAIVID